MPAVRLPVRPLVADVRARLRRIVSFCIPPLVLVALVLVGRWAAKAPTSELAIVAAASAAPLVDDAAREVDADASASAATPTTDASVAADAPRSAILTLGDGAVVVDLNLSTDDDLRRLPGIGKARAHAILELRAKLGRFKAVDDLARIKGFGRAMLRRLRPLTRV